MNTLAKKPGSVCSHYRWSLWPNMHTLEKKPIEYNEDDLGCWVDACFGHEHLRERLANMLEAAGGPEKLVVELRAEDESDDFGDVDDAVAWLNENAVVGNVVFTLDAGDLILTEDENEDEDEEIPEDRTDECTGEDGASASGRGALLE